VRNTTAWQVGPHRADATGTVAWSAKENPPALIEFNLAAVRVLEVRGPDVTSWNQSGSRVQVWLRGSVRDGAVDWVGTAIPSPVGKPIPNPIPFEAAHPRVAGARAASEEIRVRVIPGWEATVERARGWQLLPAHSGELRLRTELPLASELRLHLLPQTTKQK
jgi:hypothetical protein